MHTKDSWKYLFCSSPVNCDAMDWSALYPTHFSSVGKTDSELQGIKEVKFADIGCGYGGLLGMVVVALSTPQKLGLVSSYFGKYIFLFAFNIDMFSVILQ